ncbi:MAG: adenine deaminase [Anaerolineae bacterium]
MNLDELIQVARGERPAEMVLRNARLVNVYSGAIEDTDVAVAGRRIAGVGPGYHAPVEVDLAGKYLTPGLIDSHMHVESSMVTVAEFARAVVPQGVTTVVVDPHELANVLGLDGIRYILDASKFNPLSVYVMVSSCVPATDMETSGARLRSYDLYPFLKEKWVLGLAEVMNYPGVIHRDPDMLEKLTISADKRVDGHAPGLMGADLNAYIAAGVRSDHECTTVEEAQVKLNRGMHIMIREASNARNLEPLLPLVTPANARRCMFATDDRTPADIMDEGHVNFMLRKAVSLGLDPILAIQMATINVAEYFGLRDYGGLAPGRWADMVVFDDLQEFRARQVYRGGELVAENGQLVVPTSSRSVRLRGTVNIHQVRVEDFQIPALGAAARVIGLIPDQIVTRHLVMPVKTEDGLAVADVARDMLKLAVVERHHASGNVGLGFVQGFGLTRGALASSVAHDSHNIVVVGTNDADMMAATLQVARMQGGQCVVADGETLAALPLPIAGLMSDQPMAVVREQQDRLDAAARGLGVALHSPFMALSFLALPVIPELKLTDRGLVDVVAFQPVDLFVNP